MLDLYAAIKDGWVAGEQGERPTPLDLVHALAHFSPVDAGTCIVKHPFRGSAMLEDIANTYVWV
jgi:hypothetical protein